MNRTVLIQRTELVTKSDFHKRCSILIIIFAYLESDADFFICQLLQLGKIRSRFGREVYPNCDVCLLYTSDAADEL